MANCNCTGQCRELGYCPNAGANHSVIGVTRFDPYGDPFGPGRIAPHQPANPPIIGPGLIRPKRRLRWNRYAKKWLDASLADAISQFRDRIDHKAAAIQ